MNGRFSLIRFIIEVGLTLLGVFMLLHETLSKEPRFYILMFGIVVMAGPVTIRTIVEEWFKRK